MLTCSVITCDSSCKYDGYTNSVVYCGLEMNGSSGPNNGAVAPQTIMENGESEMMEEKKGGGEQMDDEEDEDDVCEYLTESCIIIVMLFV